MKNFRLCTYLCLVFLIFSSCTPKPIPPNSIENSSTPRQQDTSTANPIVEPPTASPTSTIRPTLTATTKYSAQITPTEPLAESETKASGITIYAYRIIKRYPHDPNAFTQGLLYHNKFLYESTGRYGFSSVRKIDLQTGKIEEVYELPPDVFGEGLALADNSLVQLTWKSRKAFIYDISTFKLLGEYKYNTEGWGLTFDGSAFIMSDGSATMRFLDPDSFTENKTVTVNEKGKPITYVNELEYVNGLIFANIWKTSKIAQIDPDNGSIVAWIDLSGIIQQEFPGIEQINFLNGIAYDEENDRLFITGKYWPSIFEIEIIETP